MQNLWAEIRRRNLHRVTAAYAVVAWVLVQGAGIAFPAFSLPSWSIKLLIILLIAGLPVVWAALWLAHPEASLTDGATHLTPLNRAEIVLIGLLGLVLIATLVEIVLPHFESTASRTIAPATTTPQATGEASIAVLAFNNMSDDPKNEYFSDGISEELLNDLAQVPGLRVAGRTSSFSFKGKSATIEDIGKTLNVHNVLEGSVQRAGNRVRITAQLINAANDFHIWSQTYDREIADIFALEDEISHTITHELTGRLLPGKASSNASPTKPKINPDAYTAYLQGRFYMNKRNKDDMLRAVDFLKQAIQLEPNYADAHASLGLTYGLLYGNGQRRDTLQAAKDETATALRLDPDNFQALLMKGNIARASWNWLEADTALRRATKLDPNDADAQHFYDGFLEELNFPEAALAQERRAVALDPLAPVIRLSIGDNLHLLNRNAEAAAEYQAALTIDPNFVFALSGLCLVDADMGKLDEAKKILSDRLIAVDGEDGPYTDFCRAIIAYRSGNLPELKRLATIAQQHYANGDMLASAVGWVYALAGDVDQAIQWNEKAFDERDPQLFSNIIDPDLPAKLKADPRWKAFMQRPLMKDWQAAHDRIATEFAASK